MTSGWCEFRGSPKKGVAMAVGWALGIAGNGAQRARGTEGRVCVCAPCAPLRYPFDALWSHRLMFMTPTLWRGPLVP